MAMKRRASASAATEAATENGDALPDQSPADGRSSQWRKISSPAAGSRIVRCCEFLIAMFTLVRRQRLRHSHVGPIRIGLRDAII